MNEELKFDFQKEKITFNQLFNSSVKRSIIGIFFKLQNEFITNTSWDPDIYSRISFTGGKKGKLKKKNIDLIINEPKVKVSLQFLINFKLLLPLPVPKDLSQLPDIDGLLENYEEYSIISGIEFDDNDVFSSPSSNLKITVGAMHHLLITMLNFKVNQTKLQTAMDELQSFPSRTNNSQMLIVLEKSDAPKKSTLKKEIFFKMTDFVYELIQEYHPLSGKINQDKNGSIFIDLLTDSLSLNQSVCKTDLIGSKTKKLLKLLDTELVLKNTTILVNKIVLRDLFIIDYENFFEDPSRLISFQSILDKLSNDSKLGLEFLKEANNTNNPLPSVFEYLDPFEKPVGVVDDFLTAFSRLYISFIISTIISNIINDPYNVFKPKAGDQIFPKLYIWLEKPSNKVLLGNIIELVSDASYLMDYYSQEEIESISKEFKGQDL